MEVVKARCNTYALLVKGLAALLRVSDALRIIDCVCRVGVSPGEEVPLGMVVRCPTCMIAAAVAQPQHGIQENVADQIKQIMEIENLEEKWRLQAEANDEAVQLLTSEPVSSEQTLDL